MNLQDSNPDFFERLKKMLKELIDKLSFPAEQIILDDIDLRNRLKISRRTSLEYRQKGYLRFYKMDGKIFYILSEVLEDIKKMRK